MTWVIGASTMFGYGIVLSDICVTRGEDKFNILQKAFPIAPYLVAGFSGSVKIGLSLLSDLSKFAELPEGEGHIAWKPDWLAQQWAPRARALFNSEALDQKKNGASIIIVGAHPTEDVGIPGWARIYLITLTAPDFEPSIIVGANDLVSIGSGEEKYREKLKGVINDPTRMRMEIAINGGFGHMVVSTIHNIIKENPESGISEHMHYFLIRRGGIAPGTNDYHYPENGKMKHFQMPEVAISYDEVLKKIGLSDTQAKEITA